MSVTELTAEGLTVAGGEAVLVRELDLHARAGRMLGVTGPSGSGKTSVLFALGGLVPALDGRLLLDGRTIVPWREAETGFIFQNLCLVPLLSALETVALSLQARGVPRSEVAERASAALELFGLGEHAGQLVSELSGGQRQRVAVARALAGRPDVILADEPASALDPHWRSVVLGLLAEEAGRGAVVVVASSDPEIIAVCDDVVTIAPA